MSVRRSLTAVLPVLDAEACRAELARQRRALERGWAKVPGLVSASLTLLPAPPSPEPAAPALFLECSFDGDFADLMFVWFMALGPELSAVLARCAEYPQAADARQFAEYVGSRARRSVAFAADAEPVGELDLVRKAWHVLDALRPASASPAPAFGEDELEARRLAVGMQEPIAGVPLVHVAWLAPGARPRLKRALRELAREPSAVDYDARFLLDGERLVFVAYPNEPAPRWSERLGHVALGACARVWQNCRGFPRRFGARRALRARRLEEFLLRDRVPVAAWFNARAPIAPRAGEPES